MKLKVILQHLLFWNSSYILLLAFILNFNTLQAQQNEKHQSMTEERLKKQRVEYLSKRMSISQVQALEIINALDKSIAEANKVYNDSTLSRAEKGQRLNILRKDV